MQHIRSIANTPKLWASCGLVHAANLIDALRAYYNCSPPGYVYRSSYAFPLCILSSFCPLWWSGSGFWHSDGVVAGDAA